MGGSTNPIYIWLNGPKDDRDSILIKESIKVIDQFPNLRIVNIKLNQKHFSSGDSIASAITWIFQNESSAIILEDDVIPSKQFLKNTNDLLIRYSENLGVGSILGSNFVPSAFIQNRKFSYRTTDFVSSWGWATWSNRWELFQFKLDNWTEYRKTLPESVASFYGRRKWGAIFRSIQNEKFDAWDYRWQFTSWKYGWVNIVPNSNLVKNIGFGENATHTTQKPEWLIEDFSDQVDTLQLVSNSLSVDCTADRWMAMNVHPSHNWYWIKTHFDRLLRKSRFKP